MDHKLKYRAQQISENHKIKEQKQKFSLKEQKKYLRLLYREEFKECGSLHILNAKSPPLRERKRERDQPKIWIERGW